MISSSCARVFRIMQWIWQPACKLRCATDPNRRPDYTRDFIVPEAPLDISENDRVLVLGASGWFGKTAVQIAKEHRALVMARTSKGNEILDFESRESRSGHFQECIDFQPTVVIDCAFVTRHKISAYGTDQYLRINDGLMDQALQLQSQTFVRRFIGVSSGAAVPYLLNNKLDQKLDLYGFQKAKYERQLGIPGDASKQNVVLLRPFSMSGKHCQTPTIYALYDLLEQSKSSRIVINSKELVYRRYTDVEDFLRVALTVPTGSEVVESGGELIEIAELAKLIVEEQGSEARIERSFFPKGADRYHSDNLSWERATKSIGFAPKNLREQIRNSARN